MEELYYEVLYSFTSGLGEMSSSRFITPIKGVVYVKDSKNRVVDEAGRLTLRFIDVELAHQEELSLYELFSTDKDLLVVGENVFDLANEEFRPEILDFLQHGVVFMNILMIDKLEVLPDHRGKGLGKLIIKDIKNRFSNSCGLIALKINSFQHGSYLTFTVDEQEWEKRMDFKSLDTDEEKSFYKLAAYFKMLGFQSIGNKGIFFLNPVDYNPIDDIKFGNLF
jgi:GNAT superfamily N-acetyltransferase